MTNRLRVCTTLHTHYLKYKHETQHVNMLTAAEQEQQQTQEITLKDLLKKDLAVRHHYAFPSS